MLLLRLSSEFNIVDSLTQGLGRDYTEVGLLLAHGSSY